jgi:predicted house-cleaning noncanonical NTP pyrophosphatase (MazG superfamily)|tara:strand:- start:477 stop:710 length:234 start_codon:yes stop_codon:yes gene_type:complete
MSKLILAKIIDKAKDEIVNKYADGMIEHIQSDEYKEKLATKINKKIDIPFVSEEKEQLFFEKIVDLVTDIIEGLVKK